MDRQRAACFHFLTVASILKTNRRTETDKKLKKMDSNEFKFTRRKKSEMTFSNVNLEKKVQLFVPAFNICQ